MLFLIPLMGLALIFLPAGAAVGSTVTYLYDGATLEFEATAVKGIVDIPLPAHLVEDSLRIKPISGCSIQRVEILSTPAGTSGRSQEPVSLQEQRSRLEDRLKALAVREDIFKSAAKTQSGKAPRKSKANPDPMQGIRQGTDFAIAQLEAVYTARRKTEQELRRLDKRIAETRQETTARQSHARLRVSPSRGKVLVRYAVTGSGWTPLYDLYLGEDSTARLYLSGQINGSYPGYVQQAAAASLSGPAAKPLPVPAGQNQRIAEFPLKVSDMQFGNGVRTTFSITLNNPGKTDMPAGETNLYRNGEYVGRIRFEGISSGKSRIIRREI